MSLYDKLKTGIIGGGGLALGKIFSLKPIDGSGDFGAWRASNGTRRNSAGVIVTEPTNMPRADYKFGRTCPAILSEPLSQNLITWSEDFGQWGNNDTSLISGVSSPKNDNSAFTLTQTTADNNNISETVSISNNTEYYFSVYVKDNGQDEAQFWTLMTGGSQLDKAIKFIFSTKTIETSGSTTVLDIGYSELNDGWFKIWVSYNSLNNTSAIIFLNRKIISSSFTFLSANFWGAQLEQSSFPTSYMATAGGVTTRQPDIIEQLQSTTESFNSPKGTIFLKMASITTDDEERKISFFGDPNDNEIRIRYYNQGIGVRMIVDGVNVASFSTQQLDQTPFRNIAFNWDETSCSFWVDGEQIGSAILTESYPEDTLLFCSIADSEGTNQFRGWLEELSVYDNNDIDMEDLTDYNTFEIMANNLNYTVQ